MLALEGWLPLRGRWLRYFWCSVLFVALLVHFMQETGVSPSGMWWSLQRWY